MTTGSSVHDEFLVSDEERGELMAGSARLAILGDCPPGLLTPLSDEFECVPLNLELALELNLSILTSADLLLVVPFPIDSTTASNAHACIEEAHFRFRLPVIELSPRTFHSLSFPSPTSDPEEVKALCRRLLHVGSARSHQQALTALHLSNEALVIVDVASGEIQFSNASANALFDPPGAQMEGLAFQTLFVEGTLMGGVEDNEGEGALATDASKQIAWKRLGHARDGRVTLHCSDATERRALREAFESERALAVNASRVATLGEFAACLAHEVNNPLSLVLGRCGQLQFALANEDGVDVEKASSLVDRIAFAARRIARIVKVTSNLSRMSASGEAPGSVSLQSVFEAVEELVRFRLGTSETIFSCSMANGHVLHVVGHESDLIQVLFNIAVNALDAVEARHEREKAEGLPRSEGWVRIHSEPLPGGMVRLSVTDSGDGVPDELSDKIWRPFVSTKAPGKGTGLGLHVCRSLAESFGGRAYHENTCRDDGRRATIFVVELRDADLANGKAPSAA